MKNFWTGVLLTFQFFTVLPIKKSYPMTRATMTSMYSAMPIVGLVFGVVLIACYQLLQLADVSSFFLAIALVVVHIICTGGLHLDGYVDVSDAFFSYGDREKRLQILDDPRTGAFGVISVVVLILLQLAALVEIFERGFDDMWLLLLCIPIILRVGVMLYFTTMKCAKTSGIAYYFSTNISLKTVRVTAIVMLVVLIALACIIQVYALLAAVIMQLVIVFVHRKFSYKNFGGMNGDLTGALYEGSNVLLWLTVLLFI